MFPELDGKRLDLLREAFPKVSWCSLSSGDRGSERGTPAL